MKKFLRFLFWLLKMAWHQEIMEYLWFIRIEKWQKYETSFKKSMMNCILLNTDIFISLIMSFWANVNKEYWPVGLCHICVDLKPWRAYDVSPLWFSAFSFPSRYLLLTKSPSLFSIVFRRFFGLRHSLRDGEINYYLFHTITRVFCSEAWAVVSRPVLTESTE